MSAISEHIAQQQNISRYSVRINTAITSAKRIHTSTYNDPYMGLFTGGLRFSWL